VDILDISLKGCPVCPVVGQGEDKVNIEELIQKLIREAGKIEPGTVTHIEVKHNDQCPTLRTGSFLDCTCKKPEIEKMQAH
jgi:hypothetical protein